jgi:hydroxymethylglutaryl-CoA synthase
MKGNEVRVGIDSLGVAFPRHYVRLADLAAARGVDPAKYEKGLGCTMMAVAHPSEDTVTLAAAAARAALSDGGIDPADIGLLVVGTETAVDHAKPAASYVQGLLGISAACRVYETKHACYGGTAGVLSACEWIASGANRGKKALVIAADIARYPLGSAGEPTQGAGAAAMVVSESPRMMSLDFRHTGLWSRDVHDFWRPLSSADALVDGALSLQCYLEGLRNAYSDFSGGNVEAEHDLDVLLFHTPFVKMAEKGHRALLDFSREEAAEEQVLVSMETRVRPSLRIASRIGNSYSASLWIGLASAIEYGGYPSGARVGLYSYGSGFCGEFFSGVLQRAHAGLIPSIQALAHRAAIDVATYEAWQAERLGEGPFAPLPHAADGFVYVGMRNGRRQYERAMTSMAMPA